MLKPPRESSKQEQNPIYRRSSKEGGAEQTSQGREQGKVLDPNQPCKHGITGRVKRGQNKEPLLEEFFGAKGFEQIHNNAYLSKI